MNVSYDDELLLHEHSNDDMHTCSSGHVTTHDILDMDVSSTSIREIETNIPENFQDTVEGLSPAKILLQQNYVKLYAPNLEAQLNIAKDRKFLCSYSKIKSLFHFCHETGCGITFDEVKEKWIGCTLEIRWKCGAGHCGEWFSSHQVNRVYCNNLLAAASLLFTGNNFTKLSLFSKCFNLAWIGESTYVNYQKTYLSPVVHAWWGKMQNEMYDALGDEPVSVCGDGQMDSPGFSAKTCVYSLMHTSLEYMLHVEVVDVRHAQMKSTVMEKVACQRALDSIKQKLNVVEVVTDACSQIIKMLGKNKMFLNFIKCVYQYPFRDGIDTKWKTCIIS